MLNFFPKTTHRAPRFLSLMFAKTGTSRRIALYGILFTLLFFGVTAYRPALLSILDNKVYDVMHSSVAGYSTPQPIIVDIDEKSLSAVGQWPWPRTLIADLIGALQKAGATVVGFDAVFSEYDRLSPGEVAKSIGNLDDSSRAALRALPENEAVMAQAMRQMPTVLGQVGLQTALPLDHTNTKIASPFRAEAGGDSLTLFLYDHEPPIC